MRKCITPVVSVVLLVLMTVGASVLAFVWINNVQSNVQESAGASVTESPGGGCSRLQVISMRGDGVTVSNVGCDTVSNITLLINGELTNYDLDSPLAPGQAGFISYANLPKATDGCVEVVLSNGQTVIECVSAEDATTEAGFADQCANYTQCEDSNPCTNDTCVDGVCNYPNFADGPRTGCIGSTGCTGSYCECVSGTCINVPPAGCQETEILCNAAFLSGTITYDNNNYCSCCGDDGLNDVFYNSSHMCSFAGVLTDQDGLYVEDWLSDYYYYSSGKGVCEYKGNDWFSINSNFSLYYTHTLGSFPYKLAVGDLDSDGNLDVVTTSATGGALGVSLGYGNGSFKTNMVTSLGSNPTSVALGDVDNDGDLDAVATSQGGNLFTVSLGYGNGSLLYNASYSGANSPRMIALGDFDNDNNLDVVYSDSGTGNFIVSLGYGNGTFRPISSYSTCSGGFGIAVADIDIDGNLDVIRADTNCNAVSVSFGYGNGSFQDDIRTSGLGSGTWEIAVGDLDSDGELDVVNLDTNDNTFTVSLGYGNGSFLVSNSYATDDRPRGLSIGDLDNDGILDVVVGNSNVDTYTVNYGNGDGTFQSKISYSTGSDPQSIGLGDVDGDGDLDIININYGAASFGVNLNDGMFGANGPCCGDDGSSDNFYNNTLVCCYGILGSVSCTCGDSICQAFEDKSSCPLDCTTEWIYFRHDAYRTGLATVSSTSPPAGTISWPFPTGGDVQSSPAIGDLNGDGTLEIVVGSQDDKIYAFYANGTSYWNYTSTWDVNSRSPLIADLEGDGKVEVIIGATITTESIGVLAGENGTLYWSYTTGTVMGSPGLGDIDNDGVYEIAIGSRGGNDIHLFYKNGTQICDTSAATDYIDSSPVFVDLTGDGVPEIIAGSEDKKLYAFYANCSKYWSYDVTSFIYTSSPSVADLDKDGQVEIAIGFYNGISVIHGNGSLYWYNDSISTVPTLAAADCSPGLADLDDDGYLEIVIGTDEGMVYAFNHDGTEYWSVSTGSIRSSPAIGDINDDGEYEIIIGSENNNLYAFYANGSAYWSTALGGQIQFSTPALADLDGDGKLEIAIGSLDDKVYVFNYNGTTFGS